MEINAITNLRNQFIYFLRHYCWDCNLIHTGYCQYVYHFTYSSNFNQTSATIYLYFPFANYTKKIKLAPKNITQSIIGYQSIYVSGHIYNIGVQQNGKSGMESINPLESIAYKELAGQLLPKREQGLCFHQKDIYSVGGHSLGIVNDCEKYSIANNKWGALPPINMKRSNNCVIMAKSGTLYTFCGFTFPSAYPGEKTSPLLNSIEKLSKDASNWVVISPSSKQIIHRQNAFVFNGYDGAIYLCGGNLGCYGQTNKCERILFDENDKYSLTFGHKLLTKSSFRCSLPVKICFKTFCMDDFKVIHGYNLVSNYWELYSNNE